MRGRQEPPITCYWDWQRRQERRGAVPGGFLVPWQPGTYGPVIHTPSHAGEGAATCPALCLSLGCRALSAPGLLGQRRGGGGETANNQSHTQLPLRGLRWEVCAQHRAPPQTPQWAGRSPRKCTGHPHPQLRGEAQPADARLSSSWEPGTFLGDGLAPAGLRAPPCPHVCSTCARTSSSLS